MAWKRTRDVVFARPAARHMDFVSGRRRVSKKPTSIGAAATSAAESGASGKPTASGLPPGKQLGVISGLALAALLAHSAACNQMSVAYRRDSPTTCRGIKPRPGDEYNYTRTYMLAPLYVSNGPSTLRGTVYHIYILHASPPRSRRFVAAAGGEAKKWPVSNVRN